MYNSNMLTCEQDYTDTVPASALGFVLEPPAPELPSTIPPERLAESLAPAEREQFLADLIKQNALYSTYEIQRQLSLEATDVSTPRSQRISILDQMAKLSGLSAKQAAKEVGAAVSITINMPKRHAKPITVEGNVIDITPEAAEP